MTTTETKTAAASAQPETKDAEFQILNPADIGISPWNRKHFDDAKQLELNESVKDRGVIQPVIVRPNPRYVAQAVFDTEVPQLVVYYVIQTNEGTFVKQVSSQDEADAFLAQYNAPKFELIAGERRWKAATWAGKLLPAMVKPAPDKQALEEQAVENGQREDPNAIDEAEKYQQLIRIYNSEGITGKPAVAMVAKHVKKSVSHVYGRLQLLTLPDAVKAATFEGKLDGSHAGLIAKIDDPKRQAEVAKEVMTKDKNTGETMSFRETEKRVEEVNKELELELERDWAKTTKEYEAKGCTVLSLKESRKVMPWSGYPHICSDEYVKPDSHFCAYPGASKPWEEWLGKDTPPGVVIYHDSGVMVAYRKTDAMAILKEKGLLEPPQSSEGDEAEAEKERLEKEERDRAEAIRKVKWGHAMAQAAATAEAGETGGLWQLILGQMVEDFEMLDNCEAVLERRQIKVPEGVETEEFMPKLIAKLSVKEARGWVGVAR